MQIDFSDDIQTLHRAFFTDTEYSCFCHDIALLRGCLIAGLPLICAERAEHYYKSMGWSLFHEITIIHTINSTSCSSVLPVNLDSLLKAFKAAPICQLEAESYVLPLNL
jgi:hypothetical protein